MMLSSEDADVHAFVANGRDPVDIFRRAFEAAPHGVVISDDHGIIRFVNALAAAIFAYSPDELIGEPLSRIMPERAAAADDDQWWEFWNSREDRSTIAGRTVAGLTRNDLIVPVDLRLNVLVEGDTRYIVASIIDLTDRLNVEARLAAVTNSHLGFQRLVADVAARFVSIDSEMVDKAIVDNLRQIGEALRLDRAILWHKAPGDSVMRATHYWLDPPETPPPAPFTATSSPYVMRRLEAGEAVWFSGPDDLPDPVDRETYRTRGPRSKAIVPLPSTEPANRELRALALGSMTREQEWVPAIIERLRLVAAVIGQALERRDSHLALEKALDEIRRLRDRLTKENVELRREVKVLQTSFPIVSESRAIQQVLAQIEQVAPTPATVLLLGETGTGKEVMAQAIHDLSPRHQRTMIRVSCAAIPAALIESELFGRERGAYTGALSRQIGRFEAAHHSTLFLDEIGELPMEVQVKLLRVLQERVIERLGSTQAIKVDVRIIAATNRSLEDAVRSKTFREDLFYRLNVFPVTIPPLRERIEDIPALVWSFIDEFSRSFGKPIESISKESLRELQRYPWPGNVRELRNVIERAVIVASGTQLIVPAPRLGDLPMPQTAMTLLALELSHIRAVLESTGWRVRGPGGAAERLGLKPTTLESRMARLGITRNRAS
jgi:formate hydrogenlyase transcriptional activator